MANKKFTEEDMNHLRASPYVLDVSPSIVHFTAKFKELFWNKMHEGKELWDIVNELGIDPGILGKNRLNGLKSMVRNEVRTTNGVRHQMQRDC